MQAMIFAAGVGSRLKPYTDTHPKALVPVGGVPMLRRVIDKMKQAGARRIVVNVHHFADQITDFLDTLPADGVEIAVSDESELLLDTGGGLLKAAPLFDDPDADEPLIVHNADILTDFSLSGMVEEACASGALSTLLADRRDTSRYLVADTATSRLRGWTNISDGRVRPAELEVADTDSLLAFGGVHVTLPAIFRHLQEYAASRSLTAADGTPAAPFSIIDFYIDTCRRNEFRTYTPCAPYRWHDVGKPASLAAAEAAMACHDNE